MQIKEVILELMVEDVQAAVDFYERKLGFTKVAGEEKDGALHWAQVKIGSFLLSFKEEREMRKLFPKLKPQKGATAALCIVVPDLEEMYKKLEGQVTLVQSPWYTDCGTIDFTIQDNQGYYITFQQPI